MSDEGMEQRLLDAVRDGEVLDLTGDERVDPAEMPSWGSSRTVSAALIRDLVRGRRDVEVDPHGLRLRGARITGRLDLANIAGETRVELVDCFLPDGLDLRDGRLPGLVLDRSRFGHSAQDPPVDAERFTTSAMTMKGVVVNARTPAGAVRLCGAHLGVLECDGARLENTSGPALQADRLHVDHGVFLRAGFRATGAVQLVDAHVGLLDCDGAWLENPAGPALYANGLRVDRAVFLRAGFRATGTAPAVVRLNGASIEGSLWLDTSEVTRSDQASGALIDIAETTYGDLPEQIGLSRWLELLRARTPGYAAQPYQQLAAVHRAAGHDREVRDILMAQRRDQIRRGGLRWHDRMWARFTGLALGFGYQPWRALLLLLTVLAGSVVLALVLGGQGGLAHTARASAPTTSCGVVERIGVGLDLGLPLVKTGARELCAPTGAAAGQTLTVAGWALQLAAWASATLFIAGFTGAVRKT
ncbi:hypothetical protein ABT256_27155 [Amycolatopsis japonica]|uniref:hypothetical protein n=1 Tax=Amycolatopsis japonica TaxID=208439 RepID=UPI0033203226